MLNFKKKKNETKITENQAERLPITGLDLLNTLLVDGKYATFDSSFTNEEIYAALLRCKELLSSHSYCYPSNFDSCVETPLSGRQNFCANAAIKLIMEEKYNIALHDFMDCIDDYDKGRERGITANEYTIYNCILNCFIAKLETELNIQNKDTKHTSEQSTERITETMTEQILEKYHNNDQIWEKYHNKEMISEDEYLYVICQFNPNYDSPATLYGFLVSYKKYVEEIKAK